MLSQAGQWRQYTDDRGRVYLHNAQSGETRWLWERFTDPRTRRDYYNNVLTGESRWAEEFDRPELPVQAREAQPREAQWRNDGYHKQQVQERTQTRRGKTSSYDRPKPGPDEVEEVDPSGRRIFFNKKTQQSRYVDEIAGQHAQGAHRAVAENYTAEQQACSQQSRMGQSYVQADSRTAGSKRSLADMHGEVSGGVATEQHGKTTTPLTYTPQKQRLASGQVASRSQSLGNWFAQDDDERQNADNTSSAFANVAVADAGTKKTTHKAGIFLQADGRFFCEPCARALKDMRAMESHSDGRKHAAALLLWKKGQSSSPAQKKPKFEETVPSWNNSVAQVTKADGFVRAQESSASIDTILLGSYPSSLKQWIIKSRQQDAVNKRAIDIELDAQISSALRTGEVWTKDWSSLPLPQGNSLVTEPSNAISANLLNSSDKRGSKAKNARNALKSAKTLSWSAKDAKEYEAVVSETKPSKSKSNAANPAGGPKRSASRPYHDPRQFVLGEKEGSEPVSRAGKSLFDDTSSDDLAAAFRRCKKIWSCTVVFDNENKAGGIIGRSEVLEKEFLRMNNYEADPDEVRPLHVLEKSLDFILNKYRSSNADYIYLVKQFKSMRQDLLVQNIRNEFAVRMYEEHARIAIQNKDVGELNQCLTQLRELYHSVQSDNRDEFTAYSLLYEVYTSFLSSSNKRNIMKMLKELPADSYNQPLTAFALECRKVLILQEYWKLSCLANHAPGLVGQQILNLVDFVRGPVCTRALAAMAKSFRTHLPIEVIARRLNLLPAAEICEPFLLQAEVKIEVDEEGNKAMLCKESIGTIKQLKPLGITAMGGS